MDWSFLTSLIYGKHRGGLGRRQHVCVYVRGAGPSSYSGGASAF